MKHKSNNSDDYAWFGQMAVFIGGGSLLVAFFVQSILPLIVAGIVIFLTLCFMNGLRS